MLMGLQGERADAIWAAVARAVYAEARSAGRTCSAAAAVVAGWPVRVAEVAAAVCLLPALLTAPAYLPTNKVSRHAAEADHNRQDHGGAAAGGADARVLHLHARLC